jgi:hypothetical protein
MSDDTPGIDEQKVIGEPTADESRRDQEQQAAVQDYTQAALPSRPTMKIKVYSPFRDYFDGTAFSISAENATGPFDILPRHHNFMSLLSSCDVIIRTVQHGDQRIRISGGLMHVKADQVIVFLDV